jgi:hypothetical protein
MEVSGRTHAPAVIPGKRASSSHEIDWVGPRGELHALDPTGNETLALNKIIIVISFLEHEDERIVSGSS